MGIASDFESLESLIHEKDIVKGKGTPREVYYEAEGSDTSNFVSLSLTLRSLIYRLCKFLPKFFREDEDLTPLLPEELLVEILSWLPVKSLMRFKCVSKSWESLISSSHFVNLHIHRSSSRVNADFSHARFLVLCYNNRSFYISTRSITSLLETHTATQAAPSYIYGYAFVGACNGLVCLSRRIHSKFKGSYSRVYFVNLAAMSMSYRSPRLKSSGALGFGYDSSTDTYKVVNVSPWVPFVNVYNMGDNRWRSVRASPPPRSDLNRHAHYVSNTVNWMAQLPMSYIRGKKNSTEQLMDTDPCFIVSFDLGKLKYGQLSLPYCPRRRDQFCYFMPILGVLRGCLCVSENNTKTHDFTVWQMKDYGIHQSWTKLFSINGSEQIIQWPCAAICISDNGDALLLSVSGASQGVLYTIRDNKLQGTKIASQVHSLYAENLIESLVLPYKARKSLTWMVEGSLRLSGRNHVFEVLEAFDVI